MFDRSNPLQVFFIVTLAIAFNVALFLYLRAANRQSLERRQIAKIAGPVISPSVSVPLNQELAREKFVKTLECIKLKQGWIVMSEEKLDDCVVKAEISWKGTSHVNNYYERHSSSVGGIDHTVNATVFLEARFSGKDDLTQINWTYRSQTKDVDSGDFVQQVDDAEDVYWATTKDILASFDLT